MSNETLTTMHEQELFGMAPTPHIEQAIVGWEGDDEAADVGSQDNDGTTLVKITLVRGAMPDSSAEDGPPRGHRTMARLSGFPFWCIPPKGMQCLVAIPHGHETIPGAAVIISLPGANPFTQFSKSRAKIDVGPAMDLVIKARSITLTRHASDGEEQDDYISITPEDGISSVDHKGNGFSIKDGKVAIFVCDEDKDVKSAIVLEVDKLTITSKIGNDSSMIQLAGPLVSTVSKIFSSKAAQLYLGVGATAATAAIVGPSTSSGASGVGSTSVFLQP